MKIISIGEITIDRYLRQNLLFVGGISLNYAVHAKRCGAAQSSLVSCVGNGAIDQHVLTTLAKEGVDYSHVAVVEGDSAECAIEVHDNADRIFPDGGYHLNVLKQLRLTEPIKAFIYEHDVMMTMFSGHHDKTLSGELLRLPNFGGKRVMDFGDWSGGHKKAGATAALAHLDLAFFSGDEATLADFRPIAATTDCQIVITMGAAGSAAFTDAGTIFQSALAVPKAVDSTGCGDAFQAAFTLSYFADGDVAAALHKGAAQAASVLQHFAAFDQVQPLFAGNRM